ncbi:MAG: hypothetical protein WCF84_18755 [Anaerolineae bacterium]
MTVSELIRELQAYPGDMTVTIAIANETADRVKHIPVAQVERINRALVAERGVLESRRESVVELSCAQ